MEESIHIVFYECDDRKVGESAFEDFRLTRPDDGDVDQTQNSHLSKQSTGSEPQIKSEAQNDQNSNAQRS